MYVQLWAIEYSTSNTNRLHVPVLVLVTVILMTDYDHIPQQKKKSPTYDVKSHLAM